MSDVSRPGNSSHPAPGSETVSVRLAAFRVLEEASQGREFAAAILNRWFDAQNFSPADRRLVSELVYGAIRRQATLDAILAPLIRRPTESVEAPLRTLLRLGVYQLVFLDSVPNHAAVHETVALAREVGKPRWTGFLNGVLRALSRNLLDAEPTAPAANAVPIAPGRYRLLKPKTFPDPTADPRGYLAQAFSLPAWLVDRWSERMDWDRLTQMAFYFNSPGQLWLRVNSTRTGRDEFLRQLTEAGYAAIAGPTPSSIALQQRGRIQEIPGFAEGLFCIQDLTAQRAAELLAPQPGQAVLDLCASPGTKSTHLAELMQDTGQIIATDVHADRLRLVRDNADRLGLHIILPQLIDPETQALPAGPFDRILVDAPCSNTGVLERRPEVRWRLTPNDIGELAELQTRLLRAAVAVLKPGGRLVYSTCSIESEENEDVVATVVRGQADLQLESQSTAFPGDPTDGGFLAAIRRIEGNPPN